MMLGILAITAIFIYLLVALFRPDLF
ncbi:MAG: potassium-transporting ATPase subunit F [Gammaproteobacteria bacterium]|nr:potassium-transporting ATPase subunit F [Gammaproteobacteria bacterium]